MRCIFRGTAYNAMKCRTILESQSIYPETGVNCFKETVVRVDWWEADEAREILNLHW